MGNMSAKTPGRSLLPTMPLDALPSLFALSGFTILSDPRMFEALAFVPLIFFFSILLFIFSRWYLLNSSLILSTIYLSIRYGRTLCAGVFLPENWNYKSRVCGKTVVITGASSGMGEDYVYKMVEWNAGRVIMCCRNAEKASRIKAKADTLAASLKSQTVVMIAKIELDDLSTIDKSALEIGELTENKIDFLISNAGISQVPYQKTKQGLELHWATNHVGPYSLLSKLLPMLRAAGTKEEPSRVIAYSSSAHWMPSYILVRNRGFSPKAFEVYMKTLHGGNYSPNQAYGVSKLANIFMVQNFQESENLYGSKVAFFAVHPGCVATSIIDHLISTKFVNLYRIFFCFAKSPRGGNQSALFCMTAPMGMVRPGSYYVDCAEAATSPDACNQFLRKKIIDETEETIRHFQEQQQQQMKSS